MLASEVRRRVDCVSAVAASASGVSLHPRGDPHESDGGFCIGPSGLHPRRHPRALRLTVPDGAGALLRLRE